MKKKITIITVTYNCAKTIERTIQSVIHQKYENMGYIIIDGNSNDGTKNIIDRYKNNLTYYVSEPDDGIYYAMNKGIDQVKEGYILFLNGDDYFVDDYVLDKISKHFNSDEEILIGRLIWGNKKTDLLKIDELPSRFYNVFYPHQAMFIPSSLFLRVGKYDTKYKISADYDWICRAMINNYKIKSVDETVSYFSLGGLSSSLQCIIDEYNISKKYMLLTGDEYLKDMTSNTLERARSYFFKQMILDDNYILHFKEYFNKNGIKQEQSIQIWGAGLWAPFFITILNKCGLVVDCIFDKQTNKQTLNEVKIMRFEKEKVQKVFVSTETFDKEVIEELNLNGISQDKYFSFHRFRDDLLNFYDKSSKEYLGFVNQTGLTEVLKN